MLGIVAIVVGMALVAITLIALPGIATTTTVETTVTTSRSSSLEHEVFVGLAPAGRSHPLGAEKVAAWPNEPSVTL